jgi:site-specific recombinase XerD
MITLTHTLVSIWERVKKQERRKTFGQALNEYLSRLDSEERRKSYKLYRIAGKKLITFMNGDFTLSTLSPEHIEAYSKHLHKQNLSETSIRIYLILIRVVLNYAIKLGYVSYRIHPFVLLELPSSGIRELDLTVEEIKRIRDVFLPNPLHQYARDVFMLCYYLGGINLRDLTGYNFKGQTVMRYIRHKTHRSKKGETLIVFTIQPEAHEIINKYMKEDGYLYFGKYHTYEKVYSLVYRHLPQVALQAEVNSKVSYYSARKSFAQHGYQLGLQLEQIEYCIGHSMKTNRPIFNYVRIMQGHADHAFRMILDGLR